MNQRTIDALEACIKMMEAGMSVEECLHQYPDLEPDLRKLLPIAQPLLKLSVENPSTESIKQNQMKLLTLAKRIGSIDGQTMRQNSYAWKQNLFTKLFQASYKGKPWAGKLLLSLGIAALLVLFSGGLLITSAKSLPGDSLYPVKLAVENIRVYLAPSGENRSNYEYLYTRQRVDEVSQLLTLKRSRRISFEGTVTSMEGYQWMVGDIPVHIGIDTTIVGENDSHPAIEIGMVVEVEGLTGPEGFVTANEVHIREYHLVGTVEEINQKYWQVSGVRLLIISGTQIDAGIRPGDAVIVLIRSEDIGLYALAILDSNPAVNTTMAPARILTPTPPAIDDSQNEDHYLLSGILEAIDKNYWIVSGQVVYIISTTHISDGIVIGDAVKIDYRIESNGSYTAIEIEKIEKDEIQQDEDIHETPDETEESPSSALRSPDGVEKNNQEYLNPPEREDDFEAED